MPLSNIDELFGFEELSACRDAGWPDCFNTGLFVLVPSLTTYTELVKRASEDGSFDGGDQGLLNAHFSSWSRGDISRHIPFTFNVNPNAAYTYLPAYQYFADQVKMVHFLGSIKPWHYEAQDGKVVGPNITDHTRQFLDEWHETLDTVKLELKVPTSNPKPSTTPLKQVVKGDLKASEKYVEASQPTPSTPDQSVDGVLQHINSQIRDKEHRKTSGTSASFGSEK